MQSTYELESARNVAALRDVFLAPLPEPTTDHQRRLQLADLWVRRCYGATRPETLSAFQRGLVRS